MKWWPVQEKIFFPIAFMVWPAVAWLYAMVIVLIIGAICALFGGNAFALVWLQAIFIGAVFFYTKYWFLMIPFAIAARYLSSDGRMLLAFMLPLLFGVLLSWVMQGTIFGFIMYMTLFVGTIYLFFFIWTISFIKKRGWLIEDLPKEKNT
jgi:hypothetical protein